jgi:hypothetical protein
MGAPGIVQSILTAFNDVPPATSGSLGLYVGGTACAGGTRLGDNSALFAAPPGAAAAVPGVVLRTPTLWRDATTLSVAYVLQDASGRPQVLLTGLMVSLTLTGVGGSLVISCGAPAVATGKGDCYGEASAGWYDTAAATTATGVVSTAYFGVTVASSNTFNVTLSRGAMRPAITAAGMYMALPESPRYPGDTMEPLTVYAHTGGFALSSWTLTCSYNSTMLAFASYTADAKFNAPTANTGTAGMVSFSVTGKSSSTTDAAVTGTAISVLQVSFQVRSTAPGGSSPTTLSCMVNDMINTGTLTFVSQSAASVGDDRDGWHGSGRMTIALALPIGMYAYAASAELFNTAAFTGVPVSTLITTMVVYGTPNANVLDATAAAAGLAGTCSLRDASHVSVLTVASTTAGCTASTLATANTGAAAVPLLLAAGSFSFSGILLRVWAPISANLFASDYTLSPVEGAMRPGACSSSLYQSAQLQLMATFGGDGLDSTTPLDLTCTPGVSFASSNSNVLTISGVTAIGISPGAVYVSTGSVSVHIIVASSPVVTISSLATYLLTGATWVGVPTSVPLSSSASFTASTSVVQSLTAERAMGAVVTYATFSDGLRTQVTEGLSINVRAAYASTLTVASANGNVTAMVSVGATSINNTDVLSAVWTDTCFSTVLASGNGSVTVTIPDALYANMTAATTSLAAPGSPAAAAPVSKPGTTQLMVTLTFPGPRTQTFTTDARTVYTITAGASLASISANGLLTVFPNATTGGTVTVRATFPFYPSASTLSAMQSITVVGLSALTLTASPWPAYAGAPNVTTLRRVHCTTAYQRATLKLMAHLSDGSLHDVTTSATFASSAPAVAAVAVGLLQGVAAGGASVTGTFAAVPSMAVTFTVTDSLAAISSLVVTRMSGTTFGGTVGATSALAVAVTFNDTTVFTNAIGGPSAAWVSPATLLSFTSANPGVIGVSSAGIATLYANAPATVLISATATCASGAIGGAAVTASMVVAPNLAPAVHDVDFGASNGLQFAPMVSGGTLNVPIIVNSGAGNLLSFQITAQWDPVYFTAVSCVAGNAWASYLFACTTGTPQNQALLVGSSATTTAIGASLQVGVLTLRATSSTTAAVTTINGTIAVLVTTSNGNGIAPTAVLAGNGSVSMNGGVAAAVPAGRRRMLAKGGGRALLTERSGRHLLACGSQVYGDTNADCKFDAADVLFVQRYLVAQAGYTNLDALTSWQRQQMDPTLDYLNAGFSASACGATLGAFGVPCPTGADAQYLLYAVAKKYRFLASTPTTVLSAPTTRGGALSLAAMLVDDTNSPAPCGVMTRVRFEVGLASGGASPNAALAFVVGTAMSATPAGFVVTAACGPPGTYTATASTTSNSTIEPYWAIAVLVGALLCYSMVCRA